MPRNCALIDSINATKNIDSPAMGKKARLQKVTHPVMIERTAAYDLKTGTMALETL